MRDDRISSEIRARTKDTDTLFKSTVLIPPQKCMMPSFYRGLQ